jgi:hypothetical protein
LINPEALIGGLPEGEDINEFLEDIYSSQELNHNDERCPAGH